MRIRVVAPEVWRPIPGFPGYEASSHGRVRSFRSLNGRGGLRSEPRLLSPSPIQGKPYLQLTLGLENGKQRQCRLHQLIALTFKGPRPTALHDACHNDGDASNNHEHNLRWDTKKSNSADQLQHGTRPLGSKSHLAKLTEEQVAEIKAALPNWKRGMGLEFAQRFGVGTTAISDIKRGLRWRHL